MMVGFRLKEPHQGPLTKEALRLGISVHELARSFVVTALEEKSQVADLNEAVTKMRDDLAGLRRDLATVTEVLLYGAGKVDDKEAAEWVNANLRRK